MKTGVYYIPIWLSQKGPFLRNLLGSGCTAGLEPAPASQLIGIEAINLTSQALIIAVELYIASLTIACL
jgi:hypothetical protein